MTKQSMTIHRALSELKTIDARIDKAIENFNPVGIYQEGTDPSKIKVIYTNSLKDKDVFEQDAKADYQSINDLISRKAKIKTAIVAANAITNVVIGGKEMTIADAITKKAEVVMKRKLIEVMKAKHRSSFAQMNKNNEKVDNNAQELAKVALSNANVKINDADAQEIVSPYLKAQTFHLCDVIDVGKEWIKIETEITNFETEVDAILSEINSVTKIEIE